MIGKRCFALAGMFLVGTGLAQDGDATGEYWLGAERGPFDTGTVQVFWVDENREEPSTSDPNDRRHVIAQIWYPADASEGERARYVLSPELLGESARWWLDQAEPRQTNSLSNAPVVDGPDPLPILIYNHGGGFPHFTGTFQTEFLASHGYVVVSIGHSGVDGIERYPDGYEYEPEIRESQLSDEERAALTMLELYQRIWGNEVVQATYARDVEDISFVLDRLDEWNRMPNHRFYDRLDFERVGSFGWSIGGATSIQATVDEPRIKAAINLDGWLYGRPVEATGTSVPIMLIGGSESSESLAQGPADPAFEELNAEVNRRVWQMLRLTDADWYRVAVIGAGHGHFSDLPAIMNDSAPNQLAIGRAHQVVNALTLEFFDKYLRGADRTPILSGEESPPEIRLVTRASEGESGD